jgi:5,6,7,8-tetrahydromethanopterin hydro-lyase
MQIGESFVGEGVNAAHINTVYGHRDGPAGVAWATAMAVVKPSVPAKPVTLFVTKAAPGSDTHGIMIWGPAQAGVAAGVMDAVAAGALDEKSLDQHCIIAAVWVNPAADDADLVYQNNRESMKQALINGSKGLPLLEEVIQAAKSPSNPFYSAKD